MHFAGVLSLKKVIDNKHDNNDGDAYDDNALGKKTWSIFSLMSCAHKPMPDMWNKSMGFMVPPNMNRNGST